MGPRGFKGSEYATWVIHDRHARAWSVLFEERSRRIQDNLNSALPPERRTSAEHNPLCLRCHAVDPERLAPGCEPQIADGVGCEACHGPAERWKSLHYLPGWRQTDPRQKEALGFHDTKDILVRAHVCVECHVGSGERDVNHDLIAAGHPRLRFEYGAYLANFPRHWSEREDKAGRPDFEARAWAVGQAVSAQAAVELLRYRASTPGKPWPEFAEYDCFACHHEIRGTGVRPGGPATPGALPWGRWYYAMLPDLARLQPGEAPPDLRVLDDLGALMSRRLPPDRREVAGKAGDAARALDGWSRRLAGGPQRDAGSLTRLLAGLAGTRPPAGDWDSYAQLYLALAATYNGLSDVAPATRGDPRLRGAVRDVGLTLEQALPRGPVERYDSPRDFSPELVDQRLKALEDLLGRPAP
jgi:hypothetical protein